MSVRLTHDDVVANLLTLVTQLRLADYEPTLLIAPVRGGLVPATYLSHALGDVPVLCWDDNYKAISSGNWDYSKILIVDDLSDSGDTLKQIIDVLAQPECEIRTATLIHRHSTQLVPTYSGGVVKHDEWIVFPWENMT